MTEAPHRHRQALFWLIAATTVWGLSFPLIKALHLRHPQSEWTLSCWLLVFRCALAAVLMMLWQPSMLRRITRAEWLQALGITAFGSPGLLMQAQGLATTNASTSAFLTQFYCVLLPIWAVIRLRQLPTLRIVLATGLVLLGMALLAGFDWKTLRIGPGETLTLLGAVFFTGQISLLELPRFAGNRSTTITAISLLGTAIFALAFALPATPEPITYLASWINVPDLSILLILTLGCTLFSYLMMNHWQRFVSATEAGLIYCLEPVAAAGFALFLPAWLAGWVGVTYANETLTASLLIGATLTTVANLLLHWPRKLTTP